MFQHISVLPTKFYSRNIAKLHENATQNKYIYFE